MKLEIPESLKNLVKETPFPVYITGGYIRNAICGLGKTDIDICGPVAAQALNLPRSYMIKAVNFRLGTCIIKAGADQYEYTPFRLEEYAAGGGHTPVSVSFTSDIKSDCKRRDFACNSLYYDLKKEELIDLCGALEDCKSGILRAVDPEKTFSSDGLRLMRLARIAAETGFKIEAKTGGAAVKYAHLLKDISPERKREELNRILSADVKYGVENGHYRGLKLLVKLGLLKYVIPQLLEGAGMAQNPEYHKFDVMEHIFQTVKFSAPDVRLAALFHDIAKPYCFNKFGKMHGHEIVSEKMTSEIMGPFGLRYSNDETEETCRLVKNHMYDLDGKTSENKLRLFIAKNNDIIEKLARLNYADRLGSGMRQPDAESRFLKIRNKMLEDGTPFTVADLKIDGAKLIEMGFRGALIGEILDDMLTKCICEPHLNNEEWLILHASRFEA